MDAYLDIETTGLDPTFDRITVIGLLLGDAGYVQQWYGPVFPIDDIQKALQPAEVLYTFNGAKFDLPFIQICLGLNVQDTVFLHRDLMLVCHSRGICGGLKAIERRFGITRLSEGITGLDAVTLWEEYEVFGKTASLQTLLDYNREDVVNLRVLKNVLTGKTEHSKPG